MKITFDYSLYTVRRKIKMAVDGSLIDADDFDEEVEQLILESLEDDEIYGVWLEMTDEEQAHLVEEIKNDDQVARSLSTAKRLRKHERG